MSYSMIHFIVPFRSKEVSDNWELISGLCNATLQSICNQTHSGFRVHLVCHQKPMGKFDHTLIDTIHVNWSVPSTWEEMIDDKYAKVKRGLINVRDYDTPTYVMIVDADDRVHRGLAEWVADHMEAHGWFFEKGYTYPLGGHVVYKVSDSFHQVCGSSAIVQCSETDLPARMDDDSDQFVLLRCGHHLIRSCMEERDTPLEPLPFPGACQVTDTGENHSGSSWKVRTAAKEGLRLALGRIRTMRPITPWMRKRFHLQQSQHFS
jgi:hypothetical protein